MTHSHGSRFAAAVAQASAGPRQRAMADVTAAKMNPDADVNSPDPAMTVAHLLNTAVYEGGHVDRHLKAAKKTQGDAQTFNLDHAAKHMDSLADHLHRGVAALNEHDPKIGSEYAKLDQASQATPD